MNNGIFYFQNMFRVFKVKAINLKENIHQKYNIVICCQIPELCYRDVLFISDHPNSKWPPL